MPLRLVKLCLLLLVIGSTSFKTVYAGLAASECDYALIVEVYESTPELLTVSSSFRVVRKHVVANNSLHTHKPNTQYRHIFPNTTNRVLLPVRRHLWVMQFLI